MKKKYQIGVMLVEVIVSMVIISVTVAGIMGLISHAILQSASPLDGAQSIAIAESYIEEIVLLPVDDPDGDNTGETRDSFDNVMDYDGLVENGVIDTAGNSVGNLANYTVTVDVTDTTLASIAMKKISVGVQQPGMNKVVLVAYKSS